MSNPPTPVSAQQASQGYLETPISPLPNGGTLTSGFGSRTDPFTGTSTEYHVGIDYSAPAGSPVVATESGTVVYASMGVAGSGYGGFGNTVAIDNGSGQLTQLSHLSQIDVSVGDTVAQGQIVGAVGTTGRSTGNHLHYEVKENGVPVNPNGATVGPNTYSTGSAQAVQSAAAAIAAAQYKLDYNQDQVLKDIVSGKQFLPNAANDFFNLTYHWRLFVTATDDLLAASAVGTSTKVDSFYQALAKYDQVTLAESGVTTMAIESVSMTSIVGPDFQSSSTSFTGIEMKIVEPNGAVFLDALRNAALELNVQNYQKAFYYMELTFKGYDDDDAASPGAINLAPFSNLPNGGKWLWTVSITDIQVGLNAGGGTYNLKMLPLDDTMTASSDFNLVPSSCKINTPGTVGSFFDNFTNNLNGYWRLMRFGDNQVTYEVKYHPVPDVMTADQVRAMALTPKQADKSSQSAVQFGSDGRTAQIMTGTTISQVLDTVMKSCEAAGQLALDMLPTDVIDTGQNGVNAKGFRQSILWRVEPEVHLLKYDPIYNDYGRHFVLHIFGFRNHACVASALEGITTEPVQKAIITELAHRNFMQKKYEYLFTGVNTEVIDLDLNFNLAWSVILPILNQTTRTQVAPQAKVAPSNSTEVAAQATRQAAVNTARAKAVVTPPQANAAQTNAAQLTTTSQNNVTNAKPLQDAVLAADAALTAAQNDPNTPKAKLQALQNTANQAHIAAEPAVIAGNQQRAAIEAANPLTAASQTYNREYGEDLTNSKTKYKGNAFPITIKNGSPTADPSGMSDVADATKFIYGTILNQANGPMNSQLMTIELSIRGDPYWLGPGTFERAISRATDQWSDTQPNYAIGCNVFILRFAYPLGQDDDGNLLLNNNETVTGCYQVTQVAHHFTDGKFTQVLSAYRMPIVDLFSSVFAASGTSGSGTAASGASGTNTDGGTAPTTAATANGVNVPKTNNFVNPGTSSGPSLIVAPPATFPTGAGAGLLIPKSGGSAATTGTGPLLSGFNPTNLSNTGF